MELTWIQDRWNHELLQQGDFKDVKDTFASMLLKQIGHVTGEGPAAAAGTFWYNR